MSLEPRKRIPLHDHVDDDSGGLVGTTGARQIAASAGSTAGDVTGGGTTTVSDELTLQLVEDSGAAVEIDWSYDVTDITVTENVTYTYANFPATGTPAIHLLIRRTGPGGPFTETYPASTQWDNGSGLPTGDQQELNSTEDARTTCTLFTEDGGTTVGAGAGGGGSTTTVSESHILLADGHATPFSFNDLLQMDDGSDFMWSDA